MSRKINFIFPLFFLLTSIHSPAQVKDTQTDKRFIVSNTDIRWIYVGIENHIEIVIAGFSQSSVFCRISEGELHGDSGRYVLLVPDTRGRLREVQIHVFLKNEDSTMTYCGSVNYMVKYLQCQSFILVQKMEVLFPCRK